MAKFLNMIISGEEERALHDYAVMHMDCVSSLLNRTQNRRAYVGVEVRPHPFLNSALDVGEWRVSRPGRVNLQEKVFE
jgi:hypothetical protein